MNNLFKVNQNRSRSAKKVSNILNNCEILLKLDLEDCGNKVTLYASTDTSSVQYSEVSRKGMSEFLFKLREYALNKDDIDLLIEENEVAETS